MSFKQSIRIMDKHADDKCSNTHIWKWSQISLEFLNRCHQTSNTLHKKILHLETDIGHYKMVPKIQYDKIFQWQAYISGTYWCVDCYIGCIYGRTAKKPPDRIYFEGKQATVLKYSLHLFIFHTARNFNILFWVLSAWISLLFRLWVSTFVLTQW